MQECKKGRKEESKKEESKMSDGGQWYDNYKIFGTGSPPPPGTHTHTHTNNVSINHPVYRESQVDSHNISDPKGSATVGTAARARRDPFVDAVAAEKMSARLERRVFEARFAYAAENESLYGGKYVSAWSLRFCELGVAAAVVDDVVVVAAVAAAAKR